MSARRHLSRRVAALAAIVSLFTIVAQATAEAPTTASNAMDGRARDLFEIGREAYEGGRYQIAALAFERAYDLSGHSELLFNAANAWDRSGDPSRAALALRHYLREVPDDPDTASLERRIARLEGGEATLDEASDANASANADDGWLLGRTFTWIAAAGAVISAVAAGVAWGLAQAQHSELAASCGALAGCTEDQIGSVSSLVTATNVALGVAIAATAGTVVLFFVEAPDGASPGGESLAFGVTLRGTL